MGIRRTSTIIIVALGLSMQGCAKAATPAEASKAMDKPMVAVSILPQAYFVERIAGDRVDRVTIVGPGQSPHSYEPSPQQMVDIGRASLWFTVGVEFERGLKPKIASLFPSMRIVDTVASVRYRSLEAHAHEEDGHEEAEEESRIDPHVWLGREAVTVQARAMRDALVAMDPEGADAYGKGLEAFLAEVESTYDSLARVLAPLKGRKVFVYHPAFGYFLDDLGLEQVAVETGGKEPTQKGLADLVRRALEEKAAAIFVQAQFPVAAAGTLARAMGGSVVALDPLAPDWRDNLLRMGEALRASLSEGR